MAILRCKTQFADLAICGGRPAFTEPLHVGCPNLGNRERLLGRINDILDRRRLTNNGPYVQALEHQIAELVGVRHCVAVCNGTVALEIAIRALGLKGEVIIPSLTFIATAHALQWQGITPVFCDIDPRTLCLDPQQAEVAITPRTSAIIGVHLFGHPCDVEALQGIAGQRGLQLLYDAAHAFGCSSQSRMIGGFGDAEVFSFHATKLFHTFEGGAVVTDNDDLAVKMRLMRNFGFAGYDRVVSLGTNGKMHEISAAMGLTLLESFEEIIETNYRNYCAYREGLADVQGITLRSCAEHGRANYQYIVLQVDRRLAGLSRDRLVRILWAENIRARRYFYPGCHNMEPYRSSFPHAGLKLPVTEQVCQELLSLPTGTAIGAGEIHDVCQVIQVAVRSAESLRKILKNDRPLEGELSEAEGQPAAVSLVQERDGFDLR